jgi:predicted amidohydrolase YtcJ
MTGSTKADLIIAGRVATLGGEEGFGWEDGIAVADGRVIAVGSERDLAALARPGTERWHLGEDHLVMPGITDAHLHLMSLVLAERQVDLTDADLDQTLARIRERHSAMAAAGDIDGWLLGHGWSLHSLGRWPDADLLERVAPNRPVALYAHDHHTRWISRRALQLAGIDTGSTNPDGGLIRRDETGRPTGILHEVASVLVDPAIPGPSPSELAAALQRVAAELAALGITGCHDPGELTADSGIERGPLFYRGLAAGGQLPLRVHSSVRARQLQEAIGAGFFTGQALVPDVNSDPTLSRRADRYRMGWLKLFADGSLGSRSAALLAPYSDAATNPPTGGPTGMVLTDAAELTLLLELAANAGITGQVHAIGDAAVRMVLDVFEACSETLTSGPRRRIEHAQLVDPADVARFGRLNVAASLQPVHLRSDAEPARAAWRERSENTFPLRALVESGALIPMGTDAPVEPADPWPGIAVAVCRRDPFRPDDRPTGLHNAISLSRAVRAACLDPAVVAGEGQIGRLLPGYRADLLVVPADPWRETFDPAAFASVRPQATLIDGEVVNETPGFNF